LDLFYILKHSKTNNLDLASLRVKLHQWYNRNKRDLPWRKTKDPYRIWLSEIILQQTRVNQGLPYYNKFVSNYPVVSDLADASQEKVLKDWEGLGYYSRARNMHHSAKQLVEEFGGEFPSTLRDIKRLKGVGDYTAAAIASFAFNISAADLDGNVFRVLSRLYGEKTPINSSQGKKVFQKLADDFIDSQDPATHNQAIMEFGSQYCVPKNPSCSECIFRDVCIAFKNDEVADLPFKEKKAYDRKRFLNYFLLEGDNSVLVQKRLNGIWQGLYQFPLLETEESIDEKGLRKLLQDEFLPIEFLDLVRAHSLPLHKLSHQSLSIKVWHFKALEFKGLEFFGAVELLPMGSLDNLAFPRPLRKFLDEKQLTLPL
jgi:A/G-specific adenine glycosylase